MSSSAVASFLVAVLVAGIAPAPVAEAAVDSCLVPVMTGGFGTKDNEYAWSMRAFGSDLYVGTTNGTTGTEIWRFDGGTWSQVVSGGFGDPGNLGTREMVVYGNLLVGGTGNVATGCEVWATANGSDWAQINVDGFGTVANDSVRGMAVWGGRLWVGTFNDAGGQIWSWDGTTWTQEVTNGITDPANSEISYLIAHDDGNLYAGTWRNGGANIYRFDGTVWTPVVGAGARTRDGFGDYYNTGIQSMASFQGALYAGTYNYQRGFTLWRTSNSGQRWQKVGTNGFGDRKNRYAWRMHVHDNQLYLGTYTMGTLGSPAAFTEGAQLYRSPDGNTWIQEVGPAGTLASPGIGNTLNMGIRTLESYDGDLFMGTAQCPSCRLDITGAEVWRRTPACN